MWYLSDERQHTPKKGGRKKKIINSNVSVNIRLRLLWRKDGTNRVDSSTHEVNRFRSNKRLLSGCEWLAGSNGLYCGD